MKASSTTVGYSLLAIILACICSVNVASAQTATLSAQNCIIPEGQTTCVTTINWTTTHTGWVQVRVDGLIFTCSQNKTGSAPTGNWVPNRTLTFTIYPIYSFYGSGGCNETNIGPSMASVQVRGEYETVAPPSGDDDDASSNPEEPSTLWPSSPAGSTPIKGIRFNPEVYASNGASYGNSWLTAYDDANVRTQVKKELEGVRMITGLTHITLTLSANFQLAWPTPSANQLKRLTTFVNDANGAGLKVVILAGHPCIVPNSAYTSANPSYVSTKKEVHVGGHKQGETVNGRQLFWDIPLCGNNNIEEAKDWYMAILNAIERDVDDNDGVAYVSLSGSPEIPFVAEMNVLYDGYPYRDKVLDYLKGVVPHLERETSIPIGISLLPATWETTEAKQYAMLDAMRNAAPQIFDALDYIDITSHVSDKNNGTSIKPAAVISRINGESSKKIILSDFRWRDSSLSEREVAKWHLTQVSDYKLGGWWIWHYKTDTIVGIRDYGSVGSTTQGWRQPITDYVRSLSGLGALADVTTTPPTNPSPQTPATSSPPTSGSGGGSSSGGSSSGGSSSSGGGSSWGGSSSSGGTSGSQTTPAIVMVARRFLPIATQNAATWPVLSPGMYRLEVVYLQLMLAADPSLSPEGTLTGHFGELTQRAVERFQCRSGIVCSGTPATTGYGVVGPRTKAAFQNFVVSGN